MKLQKIILSCKKCNKTQTFKGLFITEILEKIDNFGWGGKDDICPNCLSSYDDAGSPE